MVLAPKQMKKAKEEKESCEACMETIQLDKDKFRLGHTKVVPPLWIFFTYIFLMLPIGIQKAPAAVLCKPLKLNLLIQCSWTIFLNGFSF